MTDIVQKLRLVDPNQVLLGAPPHDIDYLPAGLICHQAAAEIERLRADAERWKYLKERVEYYDGFACFPDVWMPAPIPDSSPFDELDAAIDAAMKEGER